MTQIARFYRWLYYRCYRHSKKGGDSRFVLHWANAAIYLLIILTTNLVVLFFLFVFISPVRFAVLFSVHPWTIGAVFLGLVALQLALLGQNARYKRIISEFSTETVEEQRRGDRLFGWYLVLSVFSFIATFIVAGVRAGFPP